MMNYRHDRKWRIFIFGAVLVLTGFLFRESLSALAGRMAHEAGETLSAFLPGSDFLFEDREALILDNEFLRKELESKKDIVERLAVLTRELEEKETALNSFLRGERVVTTKILSFPRLSLYHSIVIGAGEDAGISPGDVVYGASRSAVGIIREVYSDSSTAELFSSPNLETESYFLDSKKLFRVQGLSVGGFFVKIPHDAEVRAGEIVVLSEDRRGILGTVVEIKENPQDPFKTVFIRSLVDPRTLDTIFIVAKHS